MKNYILFDIRKDLNALFFLNTGQSGITGGNGSITSLEAIASLKIV